MNTPSPLRRFQMSFLPPIAAMAVFLAVGFLVDGTTNAYTQLIILYMFINAVLALSLNLVNGFTGQFSIGHAGFMAVGAYVSAYMSMHTHILPESMVFFSYPIFAVCGGLVAAFAGWMVGLPSLRLKGDYLAIVTLGFGEIIRVVLLNTEAVGGARGMFGIPGPAKVQIGGLTISGFMTSYFWASFWVITTFIVIWRLIRSTHGRGFLSVREDEIAAEAMGINTTQMKVRAFVISSFFAGIAGSIFAHATHYLNPSTFSFAKSVDVIIMVVLGGMGSLTGSAVAAIIVTILPEWVLRPLQEYTRIDFRMVIYSLTLIIFMVMRPKGIFGTMEITSLFSRRKHGKSPTR
jgi:branched-chain amino acid transport system permease protein